MASLPIASRLNGGGFVGTAHYHARARSFKMCGIPFLQEVVVWGWDPKEAVDHFGWQGAHVGWPFRSTLAGADCIVWLTGEEAFLECIKTVGSTRRRTSAGLWGFGQWIVQTSNTQFCQSGKADLRPGLHLAPNNLPFDSGVAIP